jgi:hypothetical protein
MARFTGEVSNMSVVIRATGLAIVLLIGAVASGQEPPVNSELIDAALKLTQDAAGRYSFETNAGEAKLHPDPLLRWSNPAAGEIHGNVFLWSVNGRPAVIGSLFKWFTPHTHMSHELHSLAETPVTGIYQGRAVWRTREAGVRFAPLADAPPPAASAAQRLLQMRRLAREFAVTKEARDGDRQELRLLTQPIHRYRSPESAVLDGGMFVFVQGTDPELFLLLEARGPQDAAQWMYAAARMNSVSFRLRRRDREVWAVEIMPWGDVGSHAQVYTSFRRDGEPLRTEESP